MDLQIVLNMIGGIASFLAAWAFKRIYISIDRHEQDMKDIRGKIEHNFLAIKDDVSSLKVTLPRDYVTKNDLNQILDLMNKRFDKLEEKIDELRR